MCDLRWVKSIYWHCEEKCDVFDFCDEENFCGNILNPGYYEKVKIQSDEDFLKQLAKQGDICKIYGHRWVKTTPSIAFMTNPPQYPPEERLCTICGKKQIEKKVDPIWVDLVE